jgi:plasmid maintenance system antidote protein VapI
MVAVQIGLRWMSACPPAALRISSNGRRAITADTAVRLGRYFADSAEFWLGLQSQYCTGVVERERAPRLPGAQGQQTWLNTRL